MSISTAALDSTKKPTESNRPTKGAVLLIDDDNLVHDSLCIFLRINGFVVMSQSSGEYGLRFWAEQRERIDLVILDVNMPGINGDQVLAQMLAIDPSVRVIIISGDDLEVAKFVGSRRILKKPLEPDCLLHTIEEVLHPTEP